MTIHSLLSVGKVGVSEWARKNSESREKTCERVIPGCSYDHLFKTPFELRLKHCYEKPPKATATTFRITQIDFTFALVSDHSESYSYKSTLYM